jgi:hypothetical protein
MSENERDNILTSGPSRFQFLSAHHPSITSRQIHYLGSKLSISYPPQLLEIVCKVDVTFAHICHHYPRDPNMEYKTRQIINFCKSPSNINQVRKNKIP